MSYEPRPGTVAQRAIAHLEALGPQKEAMASHLAEAMGVGYYAIIPCLEAALKHGLVRRRQRDTHPRAPWWYSIVDQNGSQKPDDAGVESRVEAGSNTQARSEVVRAGTPAAYAGNGAKAAMATPSGDEGGAAHAEERAAHLVGRNATISMSGELAIVAECGTVVLFSAERARQLLAFFGGMAV